MMSLGVERLDPVNLQVYQTAEESLPAGPAATAVT